MSKKDGKIPTYAPDESELDESGVPVAPESYPLFKKFDALIEEVKRVADNLEKLSANIPILMGGTTVNNVTNKEVPKPEAQSVPSQPEENVPSKLEEVQTAFPEELETLLLFEEKGDYIIVKPRQFLGSENFAKIASTIRGLNGEYISAGRDSHFRVKT